MKKEKDLKSDGYAFIHQHTMLTMERELEWALKPVIHKWSRISRLKVSTEKKFVSNETR